MYLLKSIFLDPFYNLAMEEYFMRNFEDEFFILWRSEPSVILGKHQNLHEEVNLDFVRSNNIKIARRVSGGGTVFHDEDNINFTFIKKGGNGQLVDFYKHTLPIIKALSDIGLDVKFEGKNDLRISGKKISGNAEHVYKNKVLHHGTLLFKSNLDNLREALKKEDKRYTSKSVKSIRSVVTNIFDNLKEKLETEEFYNHVFESVKSNYASAEIYILTKRDIQEIEKLVDEKFKTWEWIFGYSPKYQFDNEFLVEDVKYKITLHTNRSVIDEAIVFREGARLDVFPSLLKGVRHDPIFIKEAIEKDNEKYQQFINNFEVNQFVSFLY